MSACKTDRLTTGVRAHFEECFDIASLRQHGGWWSCVPALADPNHMGGRQWRATVFVFIYCCQPKGAVPVTGTFSKTGIIELAE